MEDLINKIASRLKTLRSHKGWSLDAASRMTGVSKAMLGQIERKESCPTIATLWKIATGFDAAFSTFIEDSQITPENSKDSQIIVTPVFLYDEKLRFETFIIELMPGYEHLSLPHQWGVVEHVVVTKGEIEVLVGGNWHHLKQGSGVHFNADVPHGYRNTGVGNARIVDIIHYPG
jgi:XRE family transcriptional regulator, regulator of sulfur utilization